MSDIFIDSWGSGTPVVLVHGSLATRLDEWLGEVLPSPARSLLALRTLVVFTPGVTATGHAR